MTLASDRPTIERPSRLSLMAEQVLLTVTRELVAQLTAAMTDPNEYIPSRIRHTTYALSAVLEQIDQQHKHEPPRHPSRGPPQRSQPP